LSVSRSPADPNTAISPPPRAAATGASVSRTAWSEAGVWAKSTTTPNGWPGVDGLHPARDALDGLETRPDRRRVEAQPLPQRDDRERVVGVEAAGEAQLDRRGAGAGLIGDAQPPAVLLDPGEPDVGAVVGAVRQDRGTGLLGDADERARGRVVGVDDRGPRPGERRRGLRGVRGGRSETLEQRELGVAVRLPRAVELEVLVAEVREDRGVVGDGPDAVRREAVRRRLEDRRPVAGVGHRPESLLELGRARRRQVLRVGLAQPADLRLDRPDEPARHACRLERGHGEERGRRLAVGAGDADDPELAARVAVPPRGGLRERRPRRGDDDLGQRTLRDRPLDERRRRPADLRLAEQLVAVDVVPGDRDEQAPRPQPAGVVAETPDPDRPQRRRPDRLAALARPDRPEPLRQSLDERPQGAWLARLRGREQRVDRRHAGHASLDEPESSLASPAGRRSSTRDSLDITRPAR
jgi:hypothetical protein